MKQLYVAGTNIVITGIKQIVPCILPIDGFDAEGQPIESGSESEMLWNDQKNAVGVDGGVIYVTDDESEYRMDELEWRDDGVPYDEGN